jgi:hypothetical protein
VQEHEFELTVGETVQIGDYFVTVVDTESDDVSVRVDPVEESVELQFVDGVIVTEA